MDGQAIIFAPDTTLKELGLVTQGDICALRAFCSNAIGQNGQEPKESRDAIKRKLLEKLLEKRKKLKGSDSFPKEKTRTRRFQLGWLNYNHSKERYIMVRTVDGGGTRDVDLPEDATKSDVIQLACGLFFPGGSSKFGLECDMEFNLGNFSCTKITCVTFPDGTEKPFSLGNYFQANHLKRARLYLMSMQYKRKNLPTLSRFDVLHSRCSLQF